MVRKTKEEAQVTRELLLNAAEHLFSENGVSATSLNEIARAAGLTRGAVYWHFENKGDLLMALWERVALPIEHAFEDPDRYAGTDLLELIHAKSCWMADHIEEDPRLLSLMNIIMLRCEFATETESARIHFLSAREGCLARITRNFEQAATFGQLPAAINPEQAAIGLFGLVDGICFHWLIDKTRFSIRETTHTAVKAYLRGLTGQEMPPGPKSVQ